MFVRVVPPFLSKYLFQQKSGYKFKGCRKKNCSEIQDKYIFFQWFKCIIDYNYTKAVNRAVRTIQETTVYEFSVLNSLIYNFKTPTEESIYYKETRRFI